MLNQGHYLFGPNANISVRGEKNSDALNQDNSRHSSASLNFHDAPTFIAQPSAEAFGSSSSATVHNTVSPASPSQPPAPLHYEASRSPVSNAMQAPSHSAGPDAHAQGRTVVGGKRASRPIKTNPYGAAAPNGYASGHAPPVRMAGSPPLAPQSKRHSRPKDLPSIPAAKDSDARVHDTNMSPSKSGTLPGRDSSAQQATLADSTLKSSKSKSGQAKSGQAHAPGTQGASVSQAPTIKQAKPNQSARRSSTTARVADESAEAPLSPSKPKNPFTQPSLRASSAHHGNLTGVGAGTGLAASSAWPSNHQAGTAMAPSRATLAQRAPAPAGPDAGATSPAQAARSQTAAAPSASTAARESRNASRGGAPPTSYPAHDHADYGEKPVAARSRPFRWLPWLIAAVVAAVVLGVALGVGLGVGLSNDDDSDKNNLATPPDRADSSSPSKDGNGDKDGDEAKGGKSDDGPRKAPLPDPLPAWNWTSTKNKVFGTNLGGLFLLERWMYEDWMVEQGGPDAWDEYSMSKNLGADKMQSVLRNHLDSWFTEDDMNTLQDAGVNMLRIPMGYWPFFSAQEVGEPYQNASHLDKLSEIMYGAWNRSIYVLIDLHGMPGSQNNDQSSGHNRTNLGNTIEWYSSKNQKYSRQTVKNLLSWLDSHPAKSVVAGVTTVNEPKINSNDDYDSILRDFYDFSIEQLKPFKIPLIAHHGFVGNPYKYWKSYASDQELGTFIFDDHPYPAWFQNPEPTDKDDMLSRICNFGNKMERFPAPVLMGEFSAISILNSTDWTTDYLSTQLKVFGWSAGSTFFNFRLNETQNPVLSEPFAIGSKYSMLEMLRDNNPTGRFPRRNVSMPVVEWTNSLTSHCGSDPEISW